MAAVLDRPREAPYHERDMTPSFSPTLIAFGTAMVVFIGVAGLALGLRYLAFRTLNRWALKTSTPADGMLLMGLRIPSIAWCILLGLYPAIDTAHPHASQQPGGHPQQ